ncbi:hypothetical protein COHA_006820 [Chlorella ohadii]|uniref:Uncharacterized protein n=1 Tax=Chlorella ohadii TaxID=2649997 RepID=A0AAD5H0G8_9CHLO|nr:hypothetical protein COHA_006820 [Chlorella ohadii]
MQQLKALVAAKRKFVDFDYECKKTFLDQMEQMVEKFEVVMTRLRLADDSFSNAILQLLDVQMLEANINLAALMEAFKVEMKVMREMVQVQETSAATATLAALDQAWRQKFQGATRFKAMDAVFDDPAAMEGAQDPEYMKAGFEVFDDPSKLSNWRHKPRLYALLRKMLGQ